MRFLYKSLHLRLFLSSKPVKNPKRINSAIFLKHCWFIRNARIWRFLWYRVLDISSLTGTCYSTCPWDIWKKVIHYNKKGSDKQQRKQNIQFFLYNHILLALPLTVMETSWLLVVPAVLFATHLYVKLPLFITILLNIPELLLPNRTSFSKNWYNATGGFELAAEQLKNTTSFRHAFLALTFVVNCTSSGLTEKR